MPPNCAAWVWSSNKPLSTAGDPFRPGPDITASSSFYQANPIQIEPDSQNFYLFGDTIFDATAPATVTAVSLYQIVASSPIGSSKLSQINCVFPYTDGQGSIPANLLTEVRTRTLNGQAASTRVDVTPGIQAWPGEARFININDANYFVYISRTDSVDQLFPDGVQLLQPSVVDCTKKKC